METKIYLFAMVILSVCRASVSLDEQSCTPNKTEVTVTPNTLEDILNISNFGENITEILEEALAIETEIVEEAFASALTYYEDQDFNATEMITKHGFKVEVHEVTTKDGYVLTMHRIIGNGSAVFMMHALPCSTDDWFTAGSDNSLALELAAAGYDVWMGNARGNKYSYKHISLSPECDEFWKFSVDEISLIDVPTMIDYALNVTGKSQLSYVGYSQGTTNLAALCSELPEYNEKISVAALLGPSIYMSHWKSPIFRLISLNPEAIYQFAQSIGLNNVAPAEIVKPIITALCGNNPLSKIICSNIAGLLYGYGRGQLNIARFPVFLSHFPSSFSVRQVIHYGQLSRSGKFQKFNFTKEKNLEVYGSEEPPEYNLEKVTVPMKLFYGDYDWNVNVTNVIKLLDVIPNVLNATLLEGFSHADFIWGKNNKELLNVPVVELISKYQN